MKILFLSFIFLFSVSVAESFGFEPAQDLRAKVEGADLIIIGTPIKIEEVEKLEYEPKDFKIKTAVWKCSKQGEGDLLKESFGGEESGEKAKRIPKWDCCGVKYKMEIEDDGKKSVTNSTGTTTCLTFDSPTGYLTGKTPKMYEIYLNGKKISEEEYMNYEVTKLKKQGRHRFIRKLITVKVMRVIKGEAGEEIIIDCKRGRGKIDSAILEENYSPAMDNSYLFNEKNKNDRVLFLRGIENGHYSLVIPSAKPNSTDIIIEDGRVSAVDDILKEPAKTNKNEAITISLDEYAGLIKKAMQKY